MRNCELLAPFFFFFYKKTLLSAGVCVLVESQSCAPSSEPHANILWWWIEKDKYFYSSGLNCAMNYTYDVGHLKGNFSSQERQFVIIELSSFVLNYIVSLNSHHQIRHGQLGTEKYQEKMKITINLVISTAERVVCQFCEQANIQDQLYSVHGFWLFNEMMSLTQQTATFLTWKSF